MLPPVAKLRHDAREPTGGAMEPETVSALAAANGVKLAPEAAERIAGVLKPVLARLRETSARTGFDAEPAALLKVLRP
jgi:hypothetical protein